jgi:hypothetical protein
MEGEVKQTVSYHIDGEVGHKTWFGWGNVVDQRKAIAAANKYSKMHGHKFRVVKVTTTKTEEVIHQTEA